MKKNSIPLKYRRQRKAWGFKQMKLIDDEE